MGALGKTPADGRQRFDARRWWRVRVPCLALASALAATTPLPAWVLSGCRRSSGHALIQASLGQVRHLSSIQRAAEAEDAGSSKDAEDTTNVELFRQSLIQGWGGGEVGSGGGAQTDWAELLEPASVRAGDVLLADPSRFFAADSSSLALRRLGMKESLPAEFLSRRERLRALPVVLLTRVDKESGKAEGVWLTMRTGRLMGDFIDHFHSRPLLYGGPEGSGVTMVHPYPQVPGAMPLEDGGLYLGGSFAGAQEWVEEGEGSSLRFRFFLNQILWAKGELSAELSPGEGRGWLALRCSPDLVLSESDSMEDKPLWVKIAELAGGELEELGRANDLL